MPGRDRFRGGRSERRPPRDGGGDAATRRVARRTGRRRPPAIRTAVEEEGARGSIVQQTVFLADAALVEPCRRIVQEFYGDELPATTYVAQPSCEGKLLAIEAMGVGSGGTT